MNPVNPPPALRRPKKIREDRELEIYFQQLEFIVFQLWQKTGGGVDLIDQANTQPPILGAQIIEIQQRLGTGDALTWDDTGWTFDSDKHSFDQDEA